MKRWQVIVLAMAMILVIGIAAGYRAGVRLLQDKVVTALGPGSRLSELKVNWFSIELLGLSIDAPKGWPTARTLEAERVTIIPDLRALFSDQIRISSIVIENPYLSALRNPGKLVLVPSLTEREERQNPASGNENSHAVMISTI